MGLLCSINVTRQMHLLTINQQFEALKATPSSYHPFTDPQLYCQVTVVFW